MSVRVYQGRFDQTERVRESCPAHKQTDGDRGSYRKALAESNEEVIWLFFLYLAIFMAHSALGLSPSIPWNGAPF